MSKRLLASYGGTSELATLSQCIIPHRRASGSISDSSTQCQGSLYGARHIPFEVKFPQNDRGNTQLSECLRLFLIASYAVYLSYASRAVWVHSRVTMPECSIDFNETPVKKLKVCNGNISSRLWITKRSLTLKSVSLSRQFKSNTVFQFGAYHHISVAYSLDSAMCCFISSLLIPFPTNILTNRGIHTHKANAHKGHGNMILFGKFCRGCSSYIFFLDRRWEDHFKTLTKASLGAKILSRPIVTLACVIFTCFTWVFSTAISTGEIYPRGRFSAVSSSFSCLLILTFLAIDIQLVFGCVASVEVLRGSRMPFILFRIGTSRATLHSSAIQVFIFNRRTTRCTCAMRRAKEAACLIHFLALVVHFLCTLELYTTLRTRQGDDTSASSWFMPFPGIFLFSFLCRTSTCNFLATFSTGYIQAIGITFVWMEVLSRSGVTVRTSRTFLQWGIISRKEGKLLNRMIQYRHSETSPIQMRSLDAWGVISAPRTEQICYNYTIKPLYKQVCEVAA